MKMTSIADLSSASGYAHITEEDSSVEDRILWSDEATFHLNGQVNPHLLTEGKSSISWCLCLGGYSKFWCTGVLFF